MIVVHERELVIDCIGSKADQISFLQSFPGVVRFSKKGAIFNCAGIFQIGKGPPVLVLPWFLKNSNFDFSQTDSPHGEDEFFKLISKIKSYTNASVNLGTKINCLDIILHSFLLNVDEKIKELVSLNYHQDISEQSNVIKGRWNITSDLRRSDNPIKFTCTFPSVEKDMPILIFIKAFAIDLRKYLISKKNHILIDNIVRLTRNVSFAPITSAIIADAKLWIKLNKNFQQWEPICTFAEGLFLDKNIYSKSAGVSFKFQMDKFFESIIFKIGSQIEETQILTQNRDEILGGAFWSKNDYNVLDGFSVTQAKQFSIPDIIIEDETNYIVLECKYKPFRIPLINENSRNTDLIPFGRDDRNQLLSFLMSLRPSQNINKKKISFCIIFPCREIESFAVSNLIFSSAKLHVDTIARNIIQNKNSFSEENRLSIKFIGLNMSYAIDALIKREQQVSRSLYDIIIERNHTVSTTNETSSFQKALEKRLSLSSLIVKEGKDDKSLGRVKLAKIIYLADVHLNLGLRGQYQRFAMGPLDDRMIRNDKIGIEALSIKNSIYKPHEIKREDNTNERVRYTPAANIETYTQKAKVVFLDKYDNILNLINILLPLKTEQSEIIATLYACWNDLIIIKKSNPSESEIINEFRFNWHPSKIRFDEARLKKAINWMKSKDLIPTGNGLKTVSYAKNDASGF